MKGLSALPFLLLYLLALPALAVPVEPARQPVSPPVQATTPGEVKKANEARQAEIDEAIRKLMAMGVDLKRPVEDDSVRSSAGQSQDSVNSKPSVRAMSIGDLLDYQDQLRDRLAQLENKERKAKEKDRLRAEEAKRQQAEKHSAIHQLREVEAELGDILIRRAMKGVGKMVPVPKFTDAGKDANDEPEQASGQTYSEYPEHEYIDYEIEAPVLITGKPAKTIRVKARKGVMELHQEIQDLNKVLIDSAKRMVGKPF